jgi:hypothetical protein
MSMRIATCGLLMICFMGLAAGLMAKAKMQGDESLPKSLQSIYQEMSELVDALEPAGDGGELAVSQKSMHALLAKAVEAQSREEPSLFASDLLVAASTVLESLNHAPKADLASGRKLKAGPRMDLIKARSEFMNLWNSRGQDKSLEEEKPRSSLGADLSFSYVESSYSGVLSLSYNQPFSRWFEAGLSLRGSMGHSSAGEFSSDSASLGYDLSGRLNLPLGKAVPFAGLHLGNDMDMSPKGNGALSTVVGPLCGLMVFFGQRSALNMQFTWDNMRSSTSNASSDAWRFGIGYRFLI